MHVFGLWGKTIIWGGHKGEFLQTLLRMSGRQTCDLLAVRHYFHWTSYFLIYLLHTNNLLECVPAGATKQKVVLLTSASSAGTDWTTDVTMDTSVTQWAARVRVVAEWNKQWPFCTRKPSHHGITHFNRHKRKIPRPFLGSDGAWLEDWTARGGWRVAWRRSMRDNNNNNNTSSRVARSASSSPPPSSWRFL